MALPFSKKVPFQIPETFKQSLIDTTNQAFVNGMHSALLIGGIIMIVASLITLVILPSTVTRSVEEGESAPGMDGLAPSASIAD